MKQILTAILACILFFSFLGCSQQAVPNSGNSNIEAFIPTENENSAQIPPIEVSPKLTVAVSLPATTNEYTAGDGTLIFYHTEQTMHLTLADAEVADKVILHYLNLLDDVHLQSEDLYNDAVAEYNGSSNWMPYACQFLLSPTRIDLGVLSLYGTLVTYSGSSHPNRVNMALNYDLTTGDPLTLGSIMHMDATTSQFCDLVITKLTSRAAELSLYDDFEDTVTLKFSGDESVFESFYFTETGLCFYFDIYEIAPYSSGIINIELAYEELVGLIHDAYFPTELDLADGRLYDTSYKDETAEQYVSMTEAILSDDGIPVILYTDSSVDNIRIYTTTDDFTHSTYISYATPYLHRSEAIVVIGTEAQLSSIKVYYQNKDGIQSLHIGN